MSALSHILASEPDADTAPRQATPARDAPRPPSQQANIAPMPPSLSNNAAEEHLASTPKADAKLRNSQPNEPPSANAATMSASKQRAHNGTSSGMTSYQANKSKHLKKEDGIPLWRKDIQYDFLRLVFADKTRCFTKVSEDTKECTFAEVYVDAMAKSTKCSKVLKDKLLADPENAQTMAMVCLLVNIGRMNTTLNFFPEMRAQLRTYHSIPALQAHQDANAYKQLQDAPRLKSILKGAQEDNPQPQTIEDMRAHPYPRTNVVNLIFCLSQFSPKIADLHFPEGQDFFDLIMKSSCSSESRARAFLWLIWWYSESSFLYKDVARNPFGPGTVSDGEHDPDDVVVQVRVPPLQSLTEEQEALENVDTEEEKTFGEDKRKERIAILASDPSPAMTALKRTREKKALTSGGGVGTGDEEGSEWDYPSGPRLHPHPGRYAETGSERTRSPSPTGSRGFAAVNKHPGDMRINNLLNGGDDASTTLDHSPPRLAPTPAKKGPGRGNWRRKPKGEVALASAAKAHDSTTHSQKPLLPNTGHFNFVNEGPASSHGPAWGADSAAKSFASSGPISLTFAASNSKTIPSSVAAENSHVPTPSYQAAKRHRGITQHQSAVINHRKQQIDYSLDRRIRRVHAAARVMREREGSLVRAWKRVRAMPGDYDSEEEAIRIRKARDKSERDGEDWGRQSGLGHGHGGPKKDKHQDKDKSLIGAGGIVGTSDIGDEAFLERIELWRRPRMLYAGFVRVPGEATDVGEESKSLAQMLRRASRRLQKWSDLWPGETILKRVAMEKHYNEERQRRKRMWAEMEARGEVGFVRPGLGRIGEPFLTTPHPAGPSPSVRLSSQPRSAATVGRKRQLQPTPASNKRKRGTPAQTKGKAKGKVKQETIEGDAKMDIDEDDAGPDELGNESDDDNDDEEGEGAEPDTVTVVSRTGKELDDEDREILREVEADESEDEGGDEAGDEDEEDDDDDGGDDEDVDMED